MLLRVIVGRRCDTDQLHQLLITLGLNPEFLFYKKASAQLYGDFYLIAFLKEIIAIIPSFALGGEKEICK